MAPFKSQSNGAPVGKEEGEEEEEEEEEEAEEEGYGIIH